MRPQYSLTVFFLVLLALSSFPVAAQEENITDFEIVSVNGEDADQVNRIDFGNIRGLNVDLEGANYENAKFMAYLDGEEMFMGDDEEITIKPEYEISEGEHELKIERQSRRTENVSRTTTVEVIEASSEQEDRDRRDDADQDSLEEEDRDSADEEPRKIDFEIDEIEGQDADQVNEIRVEEGGRIDVELEGADFEESRFRAFIDGEEFHVDEDGIAVISEIKNVGTGQHELKLQYYHRGEGTSNATTRIDIEEIETRESMEKPGDFEIDSVGDEEASKVNKLELSEGESIDIELDGADLGEHHFKAFLDGEELPINGDGLMVTSKVEELGKGTHTLRIVNIFRGEEAAEAETDLEITDIETREDRRKPEELETDLYDEDFNPDVDGIKVERGDGEITVTVTEEGLNSDSSEIVVGGSIKSMTKLKINFRRGLGGQGNAARLKVEEKNPEAVENSQVEVYSVLELSGQNLELIAPTIHYAVKDEWADRHDFDEAIRKRGGGRQNTEVGFYDVEEDWKRLDAQIKDTTPTHSIYGFYPRRIDQDFGLESKENTLVIGGNPEGGLSYAEGPQGQCKSFGPGEEVPPGWNVVQKTCAEMEQIRRERERLRDSIKKLREDLKSDEGRGEQADLEKLNNSLKKLKEGNLDEAEQMYEEVQEKTAKGFLRQFIIETVRDVFPF